VARDIINDESGEVISLQTVVDSKCQLHMRHKWDQKMEGGGEDPDMMGRPGCSCVSSHRIREACDGYHSDYGVSNWSLAIRKFSIKPAWGYLYQL